MAGWPTADFGQIPMSRALAQTLARASDMAGASGYSEVTLEHMLSALCDDPDAAAVLDASHVDIGRIKADTSDYVMRGIRPGMVPPGALAVSPVLKRILEAAAAAARGGRRRDINGAIVLAAIIGDGKSAASQMLQAQGLTFDEAIRALQTALNQPSRDLPSGPTAAEDVLARARERVQSRSAPSLRDIMQDLPRPAPPAPAQPAPPVHVSQPSPSQSPRPAWPGDFKPMAEGMPESQPSAPLPPAAVEQRSHEIPGEDFAYASISKDGPGAHNSPVAAPDSAASPPPAASPAPQPANVAPVEPVAPAPSPPAPSLTQPPASLPLPPPAAAMPQPVANPAVAPAPQTGPPPGAGYAYPTGQPMTRPAPPPPVMPAPQSFERPISFDIGRTPTGPMPPPIPPPIPRAGSPAGGAAPALNKTLSAPSIADPRMDHAPPPPARTPNPMPAPQPAERGRRESPAKAEIGQLAENIPRAMRVATSERVEVRIAKARAKAITEGLEGGGLAWRHDVTITQAMSVRLRAPDGGFFIETASPETQWIENQIGYLGGDDFASWRFLVTPNRRGHSRLQIIVSARTIGADGLAAETALPDQVIEVKVRTNIKRMLMRWTGWILAAVAGGAFAKFGEGALGLVVPLVQEIMTKYVG